MRKTLPRDTNAKEAIQDDVVIPVLIGLAILTGFILISLGVDIEVCCLTSFLIVLLPIIALLILFSKEEKRATEDRERCIQRVRFEEEQRVRFEEEQRAKGLVKFKDQWGTPEQVKRWREIDIGLENNFADYSPYEFEEFIAKLFRKMGYSVETTSKSKDFGADIIAKKDDETVAIQVKKNAVGNNVGAPVIQQTLGSMWKFKADKSIVITTSDFTVQAEEQARGAPVELWNRKILEGMVRKYFIDIEAE